MDEKEKVITFSIKVADDVKRGMNIAPSARIADNGDAGGPVIDDILDKADTPMDDGPEEEVEWRTVEGYASTKDIDSYGDIVLPTAFLDTVADTRPVTVLYMHDRTNTMNLMGVIDTMRIEPQKGLYIRQSIYTGDSNGRKIWAFIKKSAITEMSIGFRIDNAEEQTIDGQRVRVITKLSLKEVSMTPSRMAANSEAVVTGYKNDEAVSNAQGKTEIPVKPGNQGMEEEKGFFTILSEKIEGFRGGTN